MTSADQEQAGSGEVKGEHGLIRGYQDYEHIRAGWNNRMGEIFPSDVDWLLEQHQRLTAELARAREQFDEFRSLSASMAGERFAELRANLERVTAERDAALAVVEAAKNYTSVSRINSKDSYDMFVKLLDATEALAALDATRKATEHNG